MKTNSPLITPISSGSVTASELVGGKQNSSAFKIRVVLPYFGTLPSTFRFWLSSCRFNQSIDWLVVTDADFSAFEGGTNISFVRMTFAELKERIQKCFPFPISLDRPYKLCDFKIFYGLIWKDYLEGYDFWGYCDCDLVFGDIRKFVTDKVLAGCDKYLGHGHFSLIKTSNSSLQAIIEMTRSRGKFDYRYVLSHPEAFGFDEYDHYGITYTYLKQKPDYFESGYDHGWTVFDEVDMYVSHFRDVIKDPPWRNRSVIYRFCDGTLERVFIENDEVKFEETLYVHLITRRMSDHADSIERFLIVPDSFLPRAESLDGEFLAKYGIRFWDKRRLRLMKWQLRAWLRFGLMRALAKMGFKPGKKKSPR